MLIVALLAPVVAAVGVAVVPRPAAGPAIVRLVAGASALVWIALLVADGVETAGRFAARPAAAAAACGVALVVAASKPAEPGTSGLAVLLVTWAAGVLGVTAGVGDPSTVPLAVGLAAAAAAVALHAARPVTAALVTVGAALTVGGFAIAGETAAAFPATAFDGDAVATALALAGLAAVLVGALAGDGPVVLAVPALAAAAIVAPHASGSPAAIAVPFGLAAAAAAWFDRRALGIALVAIAALAVDPSSGLLLAAAAVVTTAVPSSPALLAAIPGAAAVAVHATREPSVATIATATAAAATGALLTIGRDLRPTSIPLRAVPAAAVGAHLAVAAGTWHWTTAGRGDPAVLGDHWNRGGAVALAAAAVAVVGAALTTGRPDLTARPAADADAATDAEPGLDDPPWANRATTAALALLGLALAALVRSSLRSV